jgi:hypothetical protein
MRADRSSGSLESLLGSRLSFGFCFGLGLHVRWGIWGLGWGLNMLPGCDADVSIEMAIANPPERLRIHGTGDGTLLDRIHIGNMLWHGHYAWNTARGIVRRRFSGIVLGMRAVVAILDHSRG